MEPLDCCIVSCQFVWYWDVAKNLSQLRFKYWALFILDNLGLPTYQRHIEGAVQVWNRWQCTINVSIRYFYSHGFFVSIWPPTSNQKLWVTFRCIVQEFSSSSRIGDRRLQKSIILKVEKNQCNLAALLTKIFFDYSNREYIWADRWRKFRCYWRSETKLLEVRLHHYQVK